LCSNPRDTRKLMVVTVFRGGHRNIAGEQACGGAIPASIGTGATDDPRT
jgi:hypothetical protein